MQECEKALAQFVIARRHTAKLLEVVEKALHFLASCVLCFSRVQGLLPVFLRGHALCLEIVANVMTVIASVPDGLFSRLFLGQLRQDGLAARGIMTLAPGEDERHAGRLVSRASMDVGGTSTP